MGKLSGTEVDQIQLYRCGNLKFPGCSKILTEGQRMKNGYCPYCGSAGAHSYYPRNWWQKLKCYLLVIRTGEIWLNSNEKKLVSAREKGLLTSTVGGQQLLESLSPNDREKVERRS